MTAAAFRPQLNAAAWRFSGVAGSIGVALVRLHNATALTEHLGDSGRRRALAAFDERLRGIVCDPGCLLEAGADCRALVLPDLLNEHHAALAANRILAAFDEPLHVDGLAVPLRVRVGVGLAPQPLARDTPLIDAAAEALLRAEHDPARVALLHATHIDSDDTVTVDLQARLARALDNCEFELHFLPTVYAPTGLPGGAEALLRWRDPQRGLLGPARFLAAAERTPLIKPISWWTIKAAVRQAAEWSRLNGPTGISVNLANAVLGDDEVVHVVRDALQIWDTPAEQLTLEVRESAAMGDTEHVSRILKSLRRMGVQVAIDDLGAGQCNLAALEGFPADLVKIDRSIIAGVTHAGPRSAIAHALVNVAHACGMQVVAEGVADVDQLARVRELGCDYAQGFVFSQPLPRDALLPWLLSHDGAAVA